MHEKGYTWFDIPRLTRTELATLQLGHLVRTQAARDQAPDPTGARQRARSKAAYRRHFGYD